ncbi:MAG: methyl-accepting chemotaxis protein [Lachnospiraceae bacterium]|nr:methyl-accepting chemotaxis protein [Lachnospiraceae bacterium]
MKIKSKLAGMVLIPMIVCSLVIGFVSIAEAEKYLDEEQKTILQVALEGFQDDVNAFQEQDVDITVFEGDTRVLSSIEGVEGTKASDIVIEKVINGQEEYFDTNVDVHGVPYYGYYIPTDDGMLFAGKPQKVVRDSMNKMEGYIVAIGVAFVALFGIIGFLIAGRMAKQIRSASKNIKEVADGNLALENVIAVTKSKDEINEMNKSTKHMVQELSGTIRTISEISENVNASSEELNVTSESVLNAMNEVSKAIEEISIGLQSQSEAVQNMVGSIGEIHGNIESISSSANDISNCSVRLDDSSSIMKQKMSEMSESNQKVNNSIESVSEKIQTISGVIENVKGIVSVIGDISSQTQLLSLNASIEAARAGEAGRGFAVVAQSISDLSEDTSKQVGAITGIINTLVKDFEECLKTISEAVADGRVQKEDIGNVIGEFEKLSNEIEETSTRVQIIGGAVEKAVSEITSISSEIEELAGISENSAASTEEVNASVEELNALMNRVTGTAEELADKSEELNRSFGFFRL